MKGYKVKVAQSQGGRSWKPGETRQLSDTDARALIGAGLVEPIRAARPTQPKRPSRRKKAAK